MNPLHLLLKPSARRFFAEADQLPGFTTANKLHGYLYLRWPYLYISLITGEHPLARGLMRLARALDRLFPSRVDKRRKARRAQKALQEKGGGLRFADTYHGKVLPTEEATKLVKIGRKVTLTAPESVVPYALARDIVLKNPDHIVVFDCPCRAARPNPCSPLDVCLVMGEPFASLVLEHNAKRARRISPDEAVAILKAENARGHVHHAFFKDVALGRFYAICNCCGCCCGAMAAQKNGVEMLASSGYVVANNAELCVGCGNCVKYCQFNALKVRERTLQVKTARCMGCGACVSKCPKDALALKLDPSRGLPLLVEELEKYASGGWGA